MSINMQGNLDEGAWYSRPFAFLAGSIQYTYFSFADGVRNTTSLYLNLLNIKRENSKLKEDNAALKAQLAQMGEMEVENQRLNHLLGFRDRTKMSLTAAKVIARDLVTDHSTIQIDRGTKDGLKSGQAVITMDGAVGYVFKPDFFTAHVLLATDRYSVIDGIVQRTRARGIVEGKSQSSCQLRYLERYSDVAIGDLVVTSGLDNIFPKGFPIAVVSQIEKKNPSVSMKVDLVPVVDPKKVEEVFVILNAAQEDFAEKISMQAPDESK